MADGKGGGTTWGEKKAPYKRMLKRGPLLPTQRGDKRSAHKKNLQTIRKKNISIKKKKLRQKRKIHKPGGKNQTSKAHFTNGVYLSSLELKSGKRPSQKERGVRWRGNHKQKKQKKKVKA